MNPTPRHRTQPPFRETQPQEPPGEPPRTWLLLASRAAVVEEHTVRIRQLARSGHVVRLGYAGGRLPAGLLRGSHRLGTLRRGPSRIVSAALTGPLPVARRLELAARHDRWLSEVAGAADEVVFLDVLAAQQLRDRVRALAPGARQWPVRESARLLTEAAAWRTLSVGARETDTRLPGRGITLSPVVEAGGTLAGLAATAPLREELARDVRPQLRRLTRWAVRRGRFEQADDLLAAVDLLRGLFGPDPREDAAAEALRIHVALVRGEDRGAEVGEPARRLLVEADAALEAGDLRETSELGAIALGLLFHQQLHTARERTPLVEDPDGFLRPLRESRVGQLLAARGVPPLGPDSLLVDRAEGEGTAGLDDGADPGAGARPAGLRVSLLPGVYGHHAAPLIAALDRDERAELTTVRPATSSFRGMMIDAPILQHRLEHALGRVPTVDLDVDREDYDAVVGADVVVADWADKGAVWTSTVVPEGTRMVVRVHSVDALSAPAQLVDWSRVDDIVFVADHIRDLFVRILGERISHARLHVVTNIVPPANFPDPLLPDASRTLGVVGWAQVVKDPAFAVEVLAHLAREDDRWRLRLIGSDFGDHHAAADVAYARAFRERVLREDVVDRIDYTGFTRELPRHLRHVGFVLSTSLREGCPVGTLEATAAGAFPVVRDWPAFAPLGAARGLFPGRCVVRTPAEAAELIRSLAEEEDRRRAVAEVREAMAEQFSDAGTTDRLLEIVLGG